MLHTQCFLSSKKDFCEKSVSAMLDSKYCLSNFMWAYDNYFNLLLIAGLFDGRPADYLFMILFNGCILIVSFYKIKFCSN